MCGEIQRKIDIDHLNELIQYQKSYYEKYNEFLFPNPIILSLTINDPTCFLLQWESLDHSSAIFR